MKHPAQTSLLIVFLAFASAPTICAASIFADSLVSSQFVTAFGSGLVTGPPDGGGLFLGDASDPPATPGFIVVHFASPLVDGAGDDIRVFDVVSSTNETADISVSSNGLSFTFVGGLNAVNNTLNIGGLFSGPFSYVRIANSSRTVSIDVDAVEGLNAVPEPTTMLLLISGFGLLCFLRRVRTS